MLNDIKQIKLKGTIFDTLTSLDFFSSNEQKKQDRNNPKKNIVKATLIYGRNGTGKSTIAKAFRHLSGESISTITDINICDESNNQVTISEEDKKHIFVFDEDYVYKNVKLQENHLETIVMLGEAVELTDKIAAITSEYDKLKIEYEKIKKDFEEYSDPNNPKSCVYHKNKIKNTLKGDNNWAGRDRIINGKKTNTGVDDSTYLKFISITPEKQRDDLIVEYKTKLEELYNAKKGTNTIDNKVPEISNVYTKFNDDMLVELLKKKIEKPILSEREKKIIKLLQEGKQEQLKESIDYFQQESVLECPYCFQKVTTEYKHSLVKDIEKVLNKEVKEYQNELKNLLLEPIDIDLSLYEKLNEYENCINLIKNINNIVSIYKEKINKKMQDPYMINNDIENLELHSEVTKLTVQLSNLEISRIKFNDKSKQTKHIIDKLNQINKEITYYDIKELAKQYDEQIIKYEKQKEIMELKEKEYFSKQTELNSLEEQRKNIKHATNAINKCLQYIFFADNRMEIKFENDVYKLLSYGKSVKPCDISVGERNIIGLCYFFTNIFSNKEEKKAYEEEYLIVIDDPVSSFDIENRIGILSLLKHKISSFLEGNEKTRAIVMTHDLQTHYDIHKIFEEIIETCNEMKVQNKYIFNSFELKNNQLSYFSYKKRQEYTELMCIIYKYATEEDTSTNIVIGNIMRQVLEAFATFEYKRDIARISTDKEILDLLIEQEYKDYFENLMYRLVLHGGSHREEQIKTMNDFDFFSHISDYEKIQTAKNILCFIYLLNKKHLLRHLKTFKNVEETLTLWCNNIKNKK